MLALLVAGADVASTTATARAPTEPVCGVCTQALDRAGEDHNAGITRGTSEMAVRVHPNGTATFTARVSRARGAETLRNATLRRAVVGDVGYVLVGERRELRTRIDGRSLVVRAPAILWSAGEYGDSTTDTAIVWHGDSDEQYAGHIDDAVTSFVPRDATVPAVRVRPAALLDWLGSLV